MKQIKPARELLDRIATSLDDSVEVRNAKGLMWKMGLIGMMAIAKAILEAGNEVASAIDEVASVLNRRLP